ncbi:MAG: DJ-1/PfpI family protein [Elusimicrobia bacterium]|jgi:protease I|nr:DJ-1/PfpI family protein [Elusimicrobiota bacterium]
MKVAFFIAFNGFRDEEYLEPKRILEKNGITVDTVSTSKGKATGKIKITADVTMTVDEINTDGYDFIGLVGGPGALKELDNKKIYEIFSKFYDSGKPVGAICISPVILAHAGMLKGRKATVWVDGIDELVKNGAFYTGNMVELDSNIITANGPLAAKEYAKAILKILKK